jgi:hypothetical protein
MATDSLYVGIEVAGGNVRVAASNGQRVTISGARHQEPNEWLELAIYGLTGVPPSVYATVALPTSMPDSVREAIVRAGRNARFEGVFVCSSPYALARGCDRQEEALAIVVADDASSLALVRGAAPCPEEQDIVRPIAGREARELAIAARCLLKTQKRDVQRRLVRSILVGGEEAELDRIGRWSILRELESIGAIAPTIVTETFAVAAGAERLAYELDYESWKKLSPVRS